MAAVRSKSFTSSDGARLALIVVAACAAGMAAIWLLAELVPATRFKDAVVLYDAGRLDRPSVHLISEALLSLLEPPLYAVWGLLLVLVALRRDGRALALAVAAVLVLAPESAELLKPLLAHPHDWVGGATPPGPASWPSGHTTAATTLALCGVLVAPHRLRPAVAAAAIAFAAAVGAALVLLAKHMPSDVVGGYLLAIMWVTVATIALRFRRPRSRVAAPGYS